MPYTCGSALEGYRLPVNAGPTTAAEPVCFPDNMCAKLNRLVCVTTLTCGPCEPGFTHSSSEEQEEGNEECTEPRAQTLIFVLYVSLALRCIAVAVGLSMKHKKFPAPVGPTDPLALYKIIVGCTDLANVRPYPPCYSTYSSSTSPIVSSLPCLRRPLSLHSWPRFASCPNNGTHSTHTRHSSPPTPPPPALSSPGLALHTGKV